MRFKKSVLAVMTIIGSLVLCAFVLLVVSLMSPKVESLVSPSTRPVPMAIKDEILGTRPNPEYPGHDEKGFRNKSVPDEVPIVAMGDSQTYGWGVRADQPWPQVLEELGGVQTYNMAWGSYGPTHRLLLWEEAIDLNPKLIIEAFYAGNDLFDSYHFVYDRKQLTELKATEQNLLKAISDAENIEPITKRISRLNKKQYFQVLDSGGVRTVLTPNYRLCAVNLSDPRIVEGHRISLEAIRLMSERALQADIRFSVLLIPTKELVFKNVVYQDSADIPSAYKTLIENEELFWQKTKDFLESQRIHFMDSLPALRGRIENGNHPYKVSRDGHPNPTGHREIAKLVLHEIERHNLLRTR